MVAVVLAILLAIGFNVIGLVLGIIGCCQPDRSIVCGLLGSILNGFLMLGVLFLICLGVAAGG